MQESRSHNYVAAPQTLRWFGENGVCSIEIGTFNSDWQEQIVQARWMFPEATVRQRVVKTQPQPRDAQEELEALQQTNRESIAEQRAAGMTPAPRP